MIKYAYAKADGQLLHIDTVTPENRDLQQYTCVECGERMTAHISGERRRHFHHYNQPQHNFETYLHKTAKELVYNAYMQAIQVGNPVLLEYREKQLCTTHIEQQKEPCPFATATKEYDLTQTYKTIRIEQRIDGLQPDLCLVSETAPPLYIEIFVTHQCEPEKISTGIRIIEIKIENEEDLQDLYNLSFPLNSGKIKYYNFKTNIVEKEYCTPRGLGCEKAFYFIRQLEQSRYTTGIATYGKILETNKGKDVFARLCTSSKNYAYDEFKSMFDEMAEQGLNLRSCTNCRYHQRHYHLYDTVFCGKMKIISHLSHGQHCPHHKPPK